MYLSRRFALAMILGAAIGCDSSGGGDDGDGPDPDSGIIPDGPAFEVEENEWVWLPVEGTTCMNGTSTGMGVNLNSKSDRLLIYMEGGGACFNFFTCAGVAHQNGFGEADLVQVTNQASAGAMDRDDPNNPFSDWNYVFLPYCTGDIFAGANANGFGGRNQVGYENVGAYLDALVPAFEGNLSQVVLSGSSAGGFGALFNFDRVQQAFGSVPVTGLDDSAPPMSDEYMTPCLQQQLRDLWGLDATVPADCPACKQADGGGLVNMATFIADKYPDRRFGIVSSTHDGVIRLFYGYGYPSCSGATQMPEQAYADGLAQLRDEILAPYDNFRVFTLDSGFHVWLTEALGSVESGGETLDGWIRGLISGGDFDDVIP